MSAFDREKVSSDVVQRQFADKPLAVGIHPSDGLPAVASQPIDLSAPPLTHDHFVCIADEREFVVRDTFGYPRVKFPPSVVNASPNGKFWVTGAVLRAACVSAEEDERNILKFILESAGVRSDSPPMVSLVSYDTKVEVFPARARCQYLTEMVTSFEGELERVTVQRLCQLRHDDSGDLLSLNDEMVVACTGRRPHDFVSADRLRRLNAKTIASGEKQVAAGGIFDVNSVGAPDELEGVIFVD